MRYIVFLLTMAAMSFSYGDYKDSSGVKIKLVSIWGGNGNVLIQTNPNHSIDGLACTSNFWLELDLTAPGYEGMLSMLLTAQATQSTVTVRAFDDIGTGFCRLDRLITEAT